MRPKNLEPSELGTKEYWDTLYGREIINHVSDPADEGTVWFENSNSEAKLVSYLSSLACDPSITLCSCSSTLSPPSSSPSSPWPRGRNDDEGGSQEEDGQGHRDHGEFQKLHTSFLDLGTGNGSLLLSLREAGWKGEMLGVDYSSWSVELARRVQQSRRRLLGRETDGAATNDGHVTFKTWDILADAAEDVMPALLRTSRSPPTPRACTSATPGGRDDAKNTGDCTKSITSTPKITPPPPQTGWDILLDKGTFDAISLSPPNPSSSTPSATLRESPAECYKSKILPLVRPGGRFLITSCNWTEEELRAWFESDGTASAQAIEDRQDQREEEEEEEEEGDKAGSLEGNKFLFEGRIEYSSFSFGGAKGQKVSSVCFRKEGTDRKQMFKYSCPPSGLKQEIDQWENDASRT